MEMMSMQLFLVLFCVFDNGRCKCLDIMSVSNLQAGSSMISTQSIELFYVCVFQASLSIWGWGGLGVVLFLVTFGPFAIFFLAFYIFCFIGG